MKQKISIYKIAQILIIIASLYGVSRVMYLQFIDNLLMILALGLSIFLIISQKYTVKKFAFTFGIGILVFLSCYYNGVYSLGISYIVILLLINRDINEYVQLLFKSEICFVCFQLVFSIIFYFTGKENLVYQFDSQGIRFSFVTQHPNIFSMIVTSIILEWIWLKQSEISLKDIIISILISLICYCFTKTDTLIVVAFLIGFYWFIVKNNVMKKIINYIAMYIFPILSVVTIWCGYAYKNTTGKLHALILQIDILLSRRIAMTAFASDLNPLRLFAGRINMYTGDYNFTYQLAGFNIDNVYLALIYNYGLVYIILITLCFFILAGKKNYMVSFWIIVFSFYGLVESQVMIATIMPCLALISLVIQKRKNKEIIKI